MKKDTVLGSEWVPVCMADKLGAEPKQVQITGVTVVVFRTQNGVHALKDICVHRGAPLSLGTVRHDCLVCPYHGWEYEASGKCVRIPQLEEKRAIPQRAHTEAFACREKYGIIWVNLQSSERDIYEFDEYDKEGFRWFSFGPLSVEAAAPRVAENFLDVGHLAFLHEGYLGDSSFPVISDYSVHQVGGRLVSDEILVIQPNSDGRGKRLDNYYVYEILGPLCVRFSKTDKNAGETLVIMLIILPEGERRSSAFFIAAANFEVDEAAFIAFQDFIFGQDVLVLENQKPEELPLDLQAELSLKSDRISIAYRQMLAEMGVTWGTTSKLNLIV